MNFQSFMHSFPLQICCILNLFCGYSILGDVCGWDAEDSERKYTADYICQEHVLLNKNLKQGLYSIWSFPSEDKLSWHALCWCLTHSSHLPFSAETNVSSHHSVPAVGRWVFPTCCILCTELASGEGRKHIYICKF